MARTRKHRRAGVPPEGDQARYVYTEQPRCPACGRTYPHLTVYGHARKASGDGSISRYVRCACGQRFIHVAE